jgi:Tir chaperone protein (CesT) family
MVSDLFESLLQELGEAMKIANLHPDSNNSCLIRLKSGLKIQLELDKKGDFLILGTDLGVVPSGKYREDLFREALKSNDTPYPLHGIFSYSKKTDHLILFEKIPLKDLNGGKIATAITPFVEKATVWKEAIEHNDIPVTQSFTSGKQTGMFGLSR